MRARKVKILLAVIIVLTTIVLATVLSVNSSNDEPIDCMLVLWSFEDSSSRMRIVERVPGCECSKDGKSAWCYSGLLRKY